MRDLLRFFIRYQFIIVFLVIESLAITILINNNHHQRAIFVAFTQNVTGFFSKKHMAIREYAALREENRQLIIENNRLYNQLKSAYRHHIPDDLTVTDTNYVRQYKYLSARIINNNTNKQFNFITLDKGRLQGVDRDMAVVVDNGVVGIVKEVSDNFASVISLLNRKFTVSARIKGSGFFGPLEWTGKGTRYATLRDIPHHAQIVVGDTVVTSGFSAIFPEGYMIGRITDYRLKGGNYFEVTVELSTDFRRLQNVQVIKNYYRKELLELEKNQGI